ncbi:MAG: MCE family protein [Thiotrichaceae bacterium]|nr:MCE family protein [Thiotrichaceae bacterium]
MTDSINKINDINDINDIPQAVVSNKSHFSLFWIIPIVALAIGGWLGYEYYQNKGVDITITLNNAEGIDERKTPIRYKDVTVGKVTGIKLDDDLDKVIINAEIVPSMAKHLGPETRFWTVRPQISVQGISGLSTLFSGNYIGMDPGRKGQAKTKYLGVESPPRVTSYRHGKTFILEASHLGALGVGSPVYYRRINVGEVAKYELNKDNDTVSITIFIKDPYSRLVRNNSMFWNISGFDIDLSLTGVSARMESLTSLLIGGIAFESPKNLSLSSPVSKGSIFPLYESKIAAKDKNKGEPLYFVMYFDESLSGLKVGAPVEFRGIQMGKIEDIRLLIREVNDIKIPVMISLYADKLSIDGDIDDARLTVEKLVKAGMYGQLNTTSLITGAQYVNLTFPKKIKPGKITLDDGRTLGLGYNELPTIKGIKLVEQAMTIVDNLNGGISDARDLIQSVDINKVMDEVSAGIADARAILNSPNVKSSTRDLAKILNNIQGLVSKIKPDIERSARDLKGTLSQVNGLVAKIKPDIEKTTGDFKGTVNEVRSLVRKVRPDVVGSARHLKGTLQKAEAISGNVNREVRPLSLQLQKTLKHLDDTLAKANTTLVSANTMLNEDSSMQYELRLLIEEVSEAANSFSILANTLQRKPNSVIFGK